MNILAWNNKIGLWNYFVGLRYEVMINRDSWGYSYFVVRGEILGFRKTNYCESITKDVFINQERELGDRR